jgi:hypothetical protein
MGLHDPFEYLKHKLWPKEGSRIKLSIWLLTTKSQESPWFTWVQVKCYILLKIFRQWLQFFFRLHFNWRFAQKIMGLKSCNSPYFGTKWHLGVILMAKHKVHYKGGGGGSPQIWVVVSFVSLCLPMVCSCTKCALIMH